MHKVKNEIDDYNIAESTLQFFFIGTVGSQYECRYELVKRNEFYLWAIGTFASTEPIEHLVA